MPAANNPQPQMPEDCKDYNNKCSEWADMGEFTSVLT